MTITFVMSRITGKALTGDAAIEQEAALILSTKIGSIVCMRDFGSDLPDLVDQPMNRAIAQKLRGATALALQRWMPGLKLSSIDLMRGDVAGAWTVLLARPSATPLSVPLAL